MLNVMANHHNNANDPFADYLWMGDMEKFDEAVEAEFEEAFQEEEFIKSCIEQLLEEEEERETVYFSSGRNGQNGDNQLDNGNQLVPLQYPTNMDSLTQDMGSLYVNPNKPSPQPPTTKTNGIIASTNGTSINNAPFKSTLNPNAAPFFMNPNAKEFVPRFTSMPSNITNGNASHAMPGHIRNGK